MSQQAPETSREADMASAVLSRASDFVNFLNAGCSPFHVVQECSRRLLEAGFTKISEGDRWQADHSSNGPKGISSQSTPARSAQLLARGGKYFFTRNQSSIVAFVVGGKYVAGSGIAIVGAHTDSPCLKIKPVSKKAANQYLQVSVEPYGGGLWHTWFDRDLSIAGRVTVNEGNGAIQHRLVRIRKPIVRIPTLAIHLDSSVREAFRFNKQAHLLPILATSKADPSKADKETANHTHTAPRDSIIPLQTECHHTALLDALAQEAKTRPESLEHLELCLYDTQPALIGGVADEFIFGARLDNLGMSYCGLQAIIDCGDLEVAPHIAMVTLFDNEEVGSTSMMGAGSHMLLSTIERLAACFGYTEAQSRDPDLISRVIYNSYLVSADMAHAIHPNYPEKHEENHRIYMNQGLVIKYNANQRYASNADTATILKEVAKRCGSPLQEFVVRNDSPCGSTIGPIIAANVGMRTIDVGNPQLSMHSIREMCGVQDVATSTEVLKEFYRSYSEISSSVERD